MAISREAMSEWRSRYSESDIELLPDFSIGRRDWGRIRGIVRHFIKGMTYRSIGLQYGISAERVRQKLYYGLRFIDMIKAQGKRGYPDEDDFVDYRYHLLRTVPPIRISVRLCGILRKSKIRTFKEFMGVDVDLMGSVKNCGRKTVIEYKDIRDEVRLKMGCYRLKNCPSMGYFLGSHV